MWKEESNKRKKNISDFIFLTRPIIHGEASWDVDDTWNLKMM